MLSISPMSLIHWLQQFSPELLSVGTFVLCVMMILLMMRFFGAAGLMVYASVAVIAANMQVLKVSYFSYSPDPVALGTVVFSSIFLVSDILNEYYGKSYAKKSVWISFAAVIMLLLMMLITLGFRPAGGPDYVQCYDAHKAMAILFTPVPAILVASLVAYVVSQMNDIWVFSALSRMTAGKFLWLRTLLSTLIGAFIDNFVFSVLAWMVFAPNPLSWDTVFYSYILGTYVIRVCVAFAGVPLLYVARIFVKK